MEARRVQNHDPLAEKPLCPKCGCPARVVVIMRARVRCEINADGTPGNVISTSREAKGAMGYECGAPHYWVVG